MRKVLVTGANGFIGSNLCAHLARSQQVDVVGLVRAASDLSFLAGLDEVTIVKGDIIDRASLAAAMRGVSVVYHVAGLAADWGPWKDFAAANVEGVENVLAEARRHGVARIVHLSSASVYGFPGGTDLDEWTPSKARPSDRYVSTKREGERLVRNENGRGLETVVIRPATVYGPNDRTTTLKLAQALTQGRFAYVDHGRPVLAPVFVGNLVDLIQLAGESLLAPGQAFNAVDDGRVSWRQFISWLCEDLGCAPPRISVPAAGAWPLAVLVEAAARAVGAKESPPVNRYRLRAVMQDNHYSNGKAKRTLGWEPSITTREGLRLTARWYLDATRQAADRLSRAAVR